MVLLHNNHCCANEPGQSVHLTMTRNWEGTPSSPADTLRAPEGESLSADRSTPEGAGPESGASALNAQELGGLIGQVFALRTTCGRFEEMLDHIETGVLLVAVPGLESLAWNRAYARLLEPYRGERPLDGTRLSEHFPDFAGGAVEALVNRALAAGERVRDSDVEIEWVGLRPVSWTIEAVPVRDAGGDFSRLLVSIAVNGERRRRAVGARRPSKADLVSERSGEIAHDLSSLLTVILGNLSLSLAELPADHSIVPGLRDSESAALRAAELTRQLLLFSRRPTLDLRPLDLNALVVESIRFLTPTIGPRVEIETRLEAAPALVMADASRLGQMLINLCINARDAMPDGGRLTLATRSVPGRSPRRSAQPGAPKRKLVELTVHDTGHGMTSEVMARIFEPFFTTKDSGQGTGLGLPVVKDILEEHGGWIECWSEPGTGTRFSAFLPLLEGDGEPSAPTGR
jgi:signal transduction histidine kinase